MHSASPHHKIIPVSQHCPSRKKNIFLIICSLNGLDPQPKCSGIREPATSPSGRIRQECRPREQSNSMGRQRLMWQLKVWTVSLRTSVIWPKARNLGELTRGPFLVPKVHHQPKQRLREVGSPLGGRRLPLLKAHGLPRLEACPGPGQPVFSCCK